MSWVTVSMVEQVKRFSLDRKINKSSLIGELSVYDLLPSYCSLTFYFDSLAIDSPSREEALWPLIVQLIDQTSRESHTPRHSPYLLFIKGWILKELPKITV